MKIPGQLSIFCFLTGTPLPASSLRSILPVCTYAAVKMASTLGDDRSSTVGVDNRIRELNRSLSSNRILVTAQRSVSDTKITFLCPICYENVDTFDRFLVAACGDDSHGCCCTCAAVYFKMRISEGRLAELHCPVGVASGGCGEESTEDPARSNLDVENPAEPPKSPVASVTSAEIEKLLRDDKAALEQFRLLSLKKENANLSECPACKNMCAPIAAEAPVVKCVDCGAKFCAFHAWAHKAESEKGE